MPVISYSRKSKKPCAGGHVRGHMYECDGHIKPKTRGLGRPVVQNTAQPLNPLVFGVFYEIMRF
jgi:hypothetical protein